MPQAQKTTTASNTTAATGATPAPTRVQEREAQGGLRSISLTGLWRSEDKEMQAPDGSTYMRVRLAGSLQGRKAKGERVYENAQPIIEALTQAGIIPPGHTARLAIYRTPDYVWQAMIDSGSEPPEYQASLEITPDA